MTTPFSVHSPNRAGIPPSVRRVSFALSASAAIGLVGCSHHTAPPPPAPPPHVDSMVAANGTIRPSLLLSGIIAPSQTVALSNSLVEPTLRVNVKEGDYVRRGEVLAVLDTSDMQANMESDLRMAASYSAKTDEDKYTAQLQFQQGPDQVTQARASLAQAQVTLRNDNLNLERYRQLLKNGYVPQQTVDTQQTTVNNDLASVRNAKAFLVTQVENAKVNGTPKAGLEVSTIQAAQTQASSELATAQQLGVEISRGTIVSPVDGYVINRNLNPGEYPGSRQIFTLEQTDVMYAILSASSADIFRLQKGTKVQLQVPGVRGATLPMGTVVAVLDQITPGSTNFAVKVRLPNPHDVLHAGMPVSGHVALAPQRGTIIPQTAFLDDNNDTVMVVDNGTAKEAHVHYVSTDGVHAIVTGLAPGSRVISNGQAGIASGQEVAIR
jgi:multidrug efflux pump subunit AcrA (membrane-fusion protein)